MLREGGGSVRCFHVPFGVTEESSGTAGSGASAVFRYI